MEINQLYYKDILENINFKLEKGDLNYLISKSGGGKSTLIKCLAGNIKYKGSIISEYNEKKIGYMNQEIYLMESLTVLETVKFYHKLFDENIYNNEFYINYLNKFLLNNIIHSKIGNNILGGISGGEKKRLILACHLLRNLPILLLDEPFTGLDHNTSQFIFDVIYNHVKQNNNICLIAMHNVPKDFYDKVDNIFILNNKTVIKETRKNSELNNDFFEIKINEDYEILNKNVKKKISSYYIFKILINRELLLIKNNKKSLLGKLLIILILGILQNLIIGSLGPLTKIVLQSKDIFIQYSYLMHLIIILFTSSVYPIIFINEFFNYVSIIKNEIDQGWYFSYQIFLIKYLLEIINIIIYSIIYSFIIWMPFIYYNYSYFILNLNIQLQMLITLSLLFNLSYMTKNQIITLGCIIFYNTFSFLFNIGYILAYKNKFIGALQYLSITFLQTNSLITSLNEQNNSFQWILKQINILDYNFQHSYQPLLISLGYFSFLSVCYFLNVIYINEPSE